MTPTPSPTSEPSKMIEVTEDIIFKPPKSGMKFVMLKKGWHEKAEIETLERDGYIRIPTVEEFKATLPSEPQSWELKFQDECCEFFDDGVHIDYDKTIAFISRREAEVREEIVRQVKVLKSKRLPIILRKSTYALVKHVIADIIHLIKQKE